MLTRYEDFILGRKIAAQNFGIKSVPELNPMMFPFQRDVTDFLLRAGRGAAFLDTGLGKTFVQLEWARVVHELTNTPVLILAPLAVGPQTAKQAEKFGIEARVVRDADQQFNGINIVNYERLHLMDCSKFGAVVLDESSILKSFSGKTTRLLIDTFNRTPYRLCCTATPAPNDYTELGNHSEFLGVLPMADMLIRWFVHDSADTKLWRIKGHAVDPFWNWVASWARCLSKPSDLGYPDTGFDLPPLTQIKHMVAADTSTDTGEFLFRIPDTSATAIHKEKRLTKDARADEIVKAIDADDPNEPWIVWCDTDYEADALTQRLPGAVEVRGSMSPEEKEERLTAFSDGKARIMITKPSIAGFGLNWQHCARVAFVGLSFSYESYYQAVRRCWRFGQTRPVQVHVAMADTERSIWDVVSRKAEDHSTMKTAMNAAMDRAHKASQHRVDYQPHKTMKLPNWLGRAA